MIILAITAISGTLGVAVKVYRDAKEKREKPWTYYARKHRRKGIVSLGLPTKKKETGKRVQEGKLALFFTDARLEQQKKLSSLTKTNPNEVSEAEKKGMVHFG